MNNQAFFLGVGKVGKAGRWKVIFTMSLLCFVLVACGSPKLGDIFILKRNVLGGMKINSMENAVHEMKMLEKMGNPDSVEEYIDLDEVASISVGESVRVTDVSDKHNMIQIQNINPHRVMVPMWLKEKKLEEAVR